MARSLLLLDGRRSIIGNEIFGGHINRENGITGDGMR